MKVNIKDEAITTFNEILNIDSEPIFSNHVDTSSSKSIVNSFNQRLRIRKLLKKPCIKTTINLEYNLSQYQIKYIVQEYIREIKWDDLQYAGFIQKHTQDNITVNIYFSRITFDKLKVIDLKFLKQNWQETEIIQKAFIQAKLLTA
ncbi:MAG: hypothetical protein HC836_19340 [Richelia sp. RM2_1_2]|nr:hypothetical protein [Richelia sp. RM2_1_2]